MKTEDIKSTAALVLALTHAEKLDEGIRALPDVSVSNVKNSAYYRIQKAAEMEKEARKLREQAAQDFAESILREDGDGWTAEQIEEAFKPIVYAYLSGK
jgi:hypothetical protein